jgi:hypothetical protein
MFSALDRTFKRPSGPHGLGRALAAAAGVACVAAGCVLALRPFASLPVLVILVAVTALVTGASDLDRRRHQPAAAGHLERCSLGRHRYCGTGVAGSDHRRAHAMGGSWPGCFWPLAGLCRICGHGRPTSHHGAERGSQCGLRRLGAQRGSEDGAKKNWAGSSPSRTSCNCTWRALQTRPASGRWPARPAWAPCGRTSTMAPGLGPTSGP